jgi:hypothetical protein
MSTPKIIKALGERQETVLQAIGWLAREGKVYIDAESRGRVVSLRG